MMLKWPVAVLDVETTGLKPGYVVELGPDVNLVALAPKSNNRFDIHHFYFAGLYRAAYGTLHFRFSH